VGGNGIRTVQVPAVTEGVVRWTEVPMRRLLCRSCGRSRTEANPGAEAMRDAFVNALSGRIASSGLASAATWCGRDPRSVSAWIDAHVGPALERDLPERIALAVHGRSLTLCEVGTGRVLDAIPPDPDALSERLGAYGTDVREVRVPLDDGLRAAVARSVPDASVSLLDGACRGRLDGFLGQALSRGGRDAALLAERVRRSGWDGEALGSLPGVSSPRDRPLVTVFMAFWSTEAEATLARPRDGPWLDVPLPEAASPERVRSLVHRAGGRGFRLDTLRDRIDQLDRNSGTRP
jgi:hypothetical protein